MADERTVALAIKMLRTDLGNAERRARSGIRRARSALDDLERFLDEGGEVFDVACNGVRTVAEVFVECSQVATLRRSLISLEPEDE